MTLIPNSASLLPGEAEFLAHVIDNLNDVDRKLVYADWLDDHDDPRSELIRVEEEMRQIAPYSDRFWELKPRRNILRNQSPEQWLKILRYGTDCEPLFTHGIPDGWKERWRLIREFTERWHNIPMNDVGGQQEKIAEYEAALGRKLPPSLREWVAFAHDLPRNERGYSPIDRVTFHLTDMDSLRAFSVWEDRFISIHGVLYDDMDRDDPPLTRFRGFELQPESTDWEMSRFLFDKILNSTEDFSGFSVNISQHEDQLLLREQLNSTFPGRGILGDIHLYQAPNIMVRLFSTEQLPVWNLDVRFSKTFTPSDCPEFLRSYDHNSQLSDRPFRQ